MMHLRRERGIRSRFVMLPTHCQRPREIGLEAPRRWRRLSSRVKTAALLNLLSPQPADRLKGRHGVHGAVHGRAQQLLRGKMDRRAEHRVGRIWALRLTRTASHIRRLRTVLVSFAASVAGRQNQRGAASYVGLVNPRALSRPTRVQRRSRVALILSSKSLASSRHPSTRFCSSSTVATMSL